jgi:hypothetical protein
MPDSIVSPGSGGQGLMAMELPQAACPADTPLAGGYPNTLILPDILPS